MQNQGLDTAILRKMGEPIGETPALGPWKTFLDRRNNATEVVNIGLVGKYDLQDAYSREMDEKSPHNVIDIMEEQKNISNMGGTMRLGAYECVLNRVHACSISTRRSIFRNAIATAMSSTTSSSWNSRRTA